jgi:hypothetical protein
VKFLKKLLPRRWAPVDTGYISVSDTDPFSFELPDYDSFEKIAHSDLEERLSKTSSNTVLSFCTFLVFLLMNNVNFYTL